MNTKKASYPTWIEASLVAISLGFETSRDYAEKFWKMDPKLHSNPRVVYPDFPGWTVFLGKQGVHRCGVKADFYPTWQQAVKAADMLGIKTGTEYAHMYRADPRLHSNLFIKYKDFPGFPISKALKIIEEQDRKSTDDLI